MVKLRTLINRYQTADCIRRKFHSLRVEHTLVYELTEIENSYETHELLCWTYIKSKIQYGARSELVSKFHTLNESIFKYDDPHELRQYQILSQR